MPTRQSISLSDPNDDWLNSQVDSGEFASKSEALNDLIRQIRRSEQDKIEAIRADLIQAEQSIEKHGCSKRSVDEIWEAAKEQHNGQI